ncbi:MAG: hypothetical protein OEZ52_16270 [Candidatus Aminicenantes bacterium]|nr:hypothetical protein [Candidatus Aminicenantes bacterium]
MDIKGCERLTDANVIIVYNLSNQDSSTKTRFHDELYGRHKNGILFKIPHKKLIKGAIEIPQRNLQEIKSVFDKHRVDYELRITIPVKEPGQIVRIVEEIEDPYEKALEFNSLDFSGFVTERLGEIGNKSLKPDELADEMLTVRNTVQKWVSRHEDDPLADVLAYMSKALKDNQSLEPNTAKRNILRVAESLKNWTVGYHVLQESKDSESLGEVLKKYRMKKK